MLGRSLGQVAGLAFVAAVTALARGVAVAESPAHQSLDWYPDGDGLPRPVACLADWARRRDDVVRQVEAVMGPLPRPGSPTPLAPRILAEFNEADHLRRKVAYHTDSNDSVVTAWLLVPHRASSASRKLPAVLCLHQTVEVGKDEPAGLAGKPSLHYARHLVQRGFVTLAPDYPSLGEYEHDFDADAYASGSMKAIYDNVRAVDFLESLPEVDGQRLGVIGHSLGGHNAIFTALFEPRLRAIVSCCGFTRFHKYYGGNLHGWSGPRYMPRLAERYGCDPDRAPFDFPELIAALAPRPFLAVAPTRDDNFEVSGVRDSIAAAGPIYALHNAAERLQAIYPEAGHDFPAEARAAAYEFLENALTAAPGPAATRLHPESADE